MTWAVEYLPEALDDLAKLDHSVKSQVFKGIRKVSENPLPKKEGGYGEPLGNKGGNDLTGFLKIKFKRNGIRVVYRLAPEKKAMKIIVVSARSDNEVYKVAAKRK
jgi:mRNA interferase RelE/StbE